MIFYLISVAVFVVDQFLKALAKSSFASGGTITLIKKLVYFTYIENRGAAFGLFQGQRILLILISLAVACVVVYFHLKTSKNSNLQIPLAFIFGGTVSNLVDRIFRSFVIDYIDLRFWPIFNVSDVMINLGVLLLILRIVFSKSGGKEF